MLTAPRRRALAAEFVGTALLVAIVVGSGISAERRTTDDAVRLLANSIATGAGLATLILTFGSVSGARFNPLVTGAAVLDRRSRLFDGIAEGAAQITGAIAGAVVANLMFDLPPIDVAGHERSSPALWLGEVVATFGLLILVLAVARSRRPDVAAFAVGGYIAAAYWFTSSTSFANPAVTIARMFSDTYSGIAPRSVPMFVVAQCIGAGLALALDRYLHPKEPTP